MEGSLFALWGVKSGARYLLFCTFFAWAGSGVGLHYGGVRDSVVEGSGMRIVILLGVIVGVAAVMVPVGMAAKYPTGQATVHLVTPFDGIAKYSGVSQEYLNEFLTGRRWGIELDTSSWTTKANVGAISQTTGKVASKATTLVVPKAASATLAAVAIQAGLMIGASYFGDWLQEETLALWGDPPQVVDPTHVELPPEIPAEAQYWWDGTSGGGVGATSCGPPKLLDSLQVVGFYLSYQAAQSACTAAKGAECGYGNLSTYSYCGGTWVGWNSVMNPNGGGANDYVWPTTDVAFKQAHIVSTTELGTPIPLSIEEMAERIEAAFDSGVPARQDRAMEMTQGAMARLAPYVNEANKNFPVEYNPSPAGSPVITPTQYQAVQDALDSTIDPSDADEVEDQESTATGDTDWEYTPQEMAEAQHQKDRELDEERKRQYDAYGHTTPTYDTSVEMPQKASLTQKIEEFLSSMRGDEGVLGVLETAGTVTTTGELCVISADMGEWGTMDFSFCEWESQIDNLGSIMLMCCSFLWLVWFFQGRGDA